MLSRRILTTLPAAAIVLGIVTGDHMTALRAQPAQVPSAAHPAFDVASVKHSSSGPGPI